MTTLSYNNFVCVHDLIWIILIESDMTTFHCRTNREQAYPCLNPSLALLLPDTKIPSKPRTFHMPIDQVSKLGPMGQIWSTACLCKQSFIETCWFVYGCFHTTMAELSSGNREHMALQSLQQSLSGSLWKKFANCCRIDCPSKYKQFHRYH